MTLTPVQVPEMPPAPIDARAIRAVLENAREGLPVDFGWAAATTAVVCGALGIVFGVGLLPMLIAPVVLLKGTLQLAVARRRRLCVARGLSVPQVDALCRRVDIFAHVMMLNRMTAEQVDALVADILSGRYALKPPPPTLA